MRLSATALVLALLCAAGFATRAHAQNIATAWQGHWSSGSSKLAITQNTLQTDQHSCTWAAAKPAKAAQCVAYPDLPVDRDQLVRLIDDAEVAVKASAKPAELPQARQALRGISKGSFDTLATSAPGQGDCARYYFLDKGLLYGVVDCTSKPQAARIQVFRKTS